MDFCPRVANVSVPNTQLTWGQLVGNPVYNLTGSTYLRPDIGGALLPWIYTTIVIIVHIPMVVIRVQRWETVQTWCLAATLLTVVIYAQAYVSTKFEPDQVLTWTPLLLIIDAGSMLQLFVLVVEAGSLVPRVKMEILVSCSSCRKLCAKTLTTFGFVRPHTDEHQFPPSPDEEMGQIGIAITLPSNPHTDTPSHDLSGAQFDFSGLGPPVTQPQPTQPQSESHSSASLLRQEHEGNTPLLRDRTFWVATGALILFIAVFVLQVMGLDAAAKADRDVAPAVSWCSPIFQPFGVAVLDGDCDVYSVDQTFNKGIGCIHIPGVHQRAWLEATFIVTCIALVLEAVDLLIMVLVNSKTRWAEVKMKRPWCTIFGGMAVLGVTLLYGIRYSYELPPGITERVVVVMDVHCNYSMGAAQLTAAGLRGANIGWNDGLFSSWGTAFFGPWAIE